MIESDGVLRHLAFFEELGRMDEGDAGWRAVSAGLVTMRLVDRWVAVGSTDRLDAWSVSSAREAIARVVDTTPTRRILTSVVDVMVACTATDMHALSPRLMAYGQGLEYDAKWGLAADVYTTIVSNTHPVEDADLAVAALLQLGFCWRMLAQFDSATMAYSNAAEVAEKVNDCAGTIRGRLGNAKIAIDIGNLPKAEIILEGVLRDAKDGGFNDIYSRALIDGALIAGSRGQHNRAAKLSHEALGLTTSQRERERILTNIATSLRYLGALEAATDAHLILAHTAQEQVVRWNSLTNLLELSASRGNELQFDRYRRDLEIADLPPQQTVAFLISAGRGCHRLGRSRQAIAYLERAVTEAGKYSLNQPLFEAESALEEAKTSAAPPQAKSIEIPADMSEIVSTVHSMKDLIGAAG